MHYTFFRNKSLKKITLSATIYDAYNESGVRVKYIFSECPNIEEVHGIENITAIGDYGWAGIFCGSTIQQEEFHFNSLISLGSSALSEAFQNCRGIKRFYFPQLVTMASDPFGWTSSVVAFSGATDVTEIHFRADMQSTVEATSRYSSKWGATNATIYFDL